MSSSPPRTLPSLQLSCFILQGTVHYNPASPSISWCPTSLASPESLACDRDLGDFACLTGLSSPLQSSDQSPSDHTRRWPWCPRCPRGGCSACWLVVALLHIDWVGGCVRDIWPVSPASLAELNTATEPQSLSQLVSSLRVWWGPVTSEGVNDKGLSSPGLASTSTSFFSVWPGSVQQWDVGETKELLGGGASQHPTSHLTSLLTCLLTTTTSWQLGKNYKSRRSPLSSADIGKQSQPPESICQLGNISTLDYLPPPSAGNSEADTDWMESWREIQSKQGISCCRDAKFYIYFWYSQSDIFIFCILNIKILSCQETSQSCSCIIKRV